MRFDLSLECCVCGSVRHYVVLDDGGVVQSAYMRCDSCGCNRFLDVVSVLPLLDIKGALV